MNETMIQNFWKKVIKSDGCWKWTAAKNESGYGMFGIGKKKLDRAHRISWKLLRGDIPKGLFVLHKCDNPECSNPEHLFLGTNLDNVRDMISKGRNSKPPPMGGHNKLDLSKEIIDLMGTMPDYKIAEKYNLCKTVIARRRKALSIPSYAEKTGNTGKFFKGMEHPRWT